MLLRTAIILAAGSNTTVLAAGDAGAPFSEWIQLVNLPLSILILYGFARGWFITGKEHQRVVEERNQERAERIEAQKALTDKAMPALQQNEQTMGKLVEAVERFEVTTRRRA